MAEFDPIEFQNGRLGNTPVNAENLNKVQQGVKADLVRIEEMADNAIAPTGNAADAGKTFDAKTGAVISVATGAALEKRLIGGVKSSVDGTTMPTKGLYATVDPANPTEIVDLAIGEVA